MLKIQEAIVVEGRYDKNTLSQVVDAVILETSGFGIFKDKEKLALLRRVGEKRGLILLTDSDGAGFVIRNYLKGALPKDQVKQAYIPDRPGKEKRKKHPGKEGKLGVEGMSPAVLEPGPPTGRGDDLRRRRRGPQGPAADQGRPLRLGPVRWAGEQGKAAGAAPGPGPAGPSFPQRDAAGFVCFV